MNDAAGSAIESNSLLVWQLLCSLAHKPGPVRVELDAGRRAVLAELVDAADLMVAVMDPEEPQELPIFEGPASDAHNWIPAGIYPAISPDVPGALLIEVGVTGILAAPTASRILPSTHTDALLLERLRALLIQAAARPPEEVLREIRTLVDTAGPRRSFESSDPRG